LLELTAEEKHDLEHRARNLHAALDVKTGKVQGETAKRHTSAEFLAFVRELVNKTRWAKQIRMVLDNPADKTKAVEEFLEQNPKSVSTSTPSRVVVCENPARGHCPWRLHVGRRSSVQTAEIYSRLSEIP
jgi:hypothetical protein